MTTEAIEEELVLPTRIVLDRKFREQIKDQRVLAAFLGLDRAEFMPEEYKETAYLNRAQDIGENTSISQPSLVAMMVELLELKGGEKVFEIGTATGYEAAILASLGCEVYTTDIQGELCVQAISRLDRLGISNVNVFVQDGAQGLPEHAPYDAMIISSALRFLPQELFFQLKDGGIVVAPVGKDPIVQQLVVGIRNGEQGRLKVIDNEVWFHKVISKVDGGWTDDLLQQSIEAKEDFFKNLLSSLSGDEKQALQDKIDEANKVLPEGDEKLTLENYYQIPTRFLRLPDDFYEKALGEEETEVSDTAEE